MTPITVWFGISAVESLHLFSALCEISLDGSCYFLLFFFQETMQLAVLPYVAGTDSRITQNTHALAMGVRFERTQAFFLKLFPHALQYLLGI